MNESGFLIWTIENGNKEIVAYYYFYFQPY